MNTEETEIYDLRPKLICEVDEANRVLRIVYTGAPGEFMHTLMNRYILRSYTRAFIDKLIQIEREAKEAKAEATATDSSAVSKESCAAPATGNETKPPAPATGNETKPREQPGGEIYLAQSYGCVPVILAIACIGGIGYMLLPRAIQAVQSWL